MNRRLYDQVLVLAAINQLKQELGVEMAKGEENWMHSGEVLMRLITLYSCLDIGRLMALAELKCAEQRDTKEEAA